MPSWFECLTSKRDTLGYVYDQAIKVIATSFCLFLLWDILMWEFLDVGHSIEQTMNSVEEFCKLTY